MRASTRHPAVNRPTTAGLGSFAEVVGSEASGYYSRLHQAGDMVWDETLQAWLITSRELVRKVGLEDDSVWQSPLVPDPDHWPLGIEPAAWVEMLGPSWKSISFLEGDAHRRFHRWWVRSFMPRALARLNETLIQPIAHAQIDRIADAGKAELVGQLARRVSPRVMVALLGLPWSDDRTAERIGALVDGRNAVL
jgi:cytochrome P450